MKRREMSPEARVQWDIAQFVARRARMTRIRAQELMDEAAAFERERARLENECESEDRFARYHG